MEVCEASMESGWLRSTRGCGATWVAEVLRHAGLRPSSPHLAAPGSPYDLDDLHSYIIKIVKHLQYIYNYTYTYIYIYNYTYTHTYTYIYTCTYH